MDTDQTSIISGISPSNAARTPSSSVVAGGAATASGNLGDFPRPLLERVTPAGLAERKGSARSPARELRRVDKSSGASSVAALLEARAKPATDPTSVPSRGGEPAATQTQVPRQSRRRRPAAVHSASEDHLDHLDTPLHKRQRRGARLRSEAQRIDHNTREAARSAAMKRAYHALYYIFRHRTCPSLPAPTSLAPPDQSTKRSAGRTRMAYRRTECEQFAVSFVRAYRARRRLGKEPQPTVFDSAAPCGIADAGGRVLALSSSLLQYICAPCGKVYSPALKRRSADSTASPAPDAAAVAAVLPSMFPGFVVALQAVATRAIQAEQAADKEAKPDEKLPSETAVGRPLLCRLDAVTQATEALQIALYADPTMPNPVHFSSLFALQSIRARDIVHAVPEPATDAAAAAGATTAVVEAVEKQALSDAVQDIEVAKGLDPLPVHYSWVAPEPACDADDDADAVNAASLQEQVFVLFTVRTSPLVHRAVTRAVDSARITRHNRKVVP